jgi:predicted transcriptional regulator
MMYPPYVSQALQSPEGENTEFKAAFSKLQEMANLLNGDEFKTGSPEERAQYLTMLEEVKEQIEALPGESKEEDFLMSWYENVKLAR